MPEAHQLDPAHVDILARIFHDLDWIDGANGRWDRIPEVWKKNYRAKAVNALTRIDSLAAKVAALAQDRA